MVQEHEEQVAALERERAELLARAEAAEAARDALADRLVFEMEQREALAARAEAAEVGRDEANLKALQAEYRVIQLAARVAELEAQLAAHQWRPVTEEPPTDDEYLVWCSSYEGCEIQSYSKRLNRWYSNTGNDADYWQPQPLRPAAAEATE